MDRKSFIILLTILGVFWFMKGPENSVALAKSARESAVGKKVEEELVEALEFAQDANELLWLGHVDAAAALAEEAGPKVKAAARSGLAKASKALKNAQNKLESGMEAFKTLTETESDANRRVARYAKEKAKAKAKATAKAKAKAKATAKATESKLVTDGYKGNPLRTVTTIVTDIPGKPGMQRKSSKKSSKKSPKKAKTQPEPEPEPEPEIERLGGRRRRPKRTSRAYSMRPKRRGAKRY